MYTDTVREADEDVRVVNTESRYVEPGEVMDRVTAILEPSDAETVYKKIDSTLRGNLVPEVSATVTETDVTSAVVVPAFPANGRTTVEGLHLVDGTPVAQTSSTRTKLIFSRHPTSRRYSSDVTRLLLTSHSNEWKRVCLPS